MSNFYIISFDPNLADTATLHEYIKNSSKYLNWWHYLSSAYIVKTNDNLAGVQADLQRNWPSNRYFIVKIDPRYYDGWINNEAYQWFRDNVN